MTRDEIRSEITRSRIAIGQDCGRLRAELDVAAKLNALVRRRPFAWLGGAAALGWILAGPKTKKRVVTKYVRDSDKRAGTADTRAAGKFGAVAAVVTAARLAFPFVKPALSAYAARWLTEFAARRMK